MSFLEVHFQAEEDENAWPKIDGEQNLNRGLGIVEEQDKFNWNAMNIRLILIR